MNAQELATATEAASEIAAAFNAKVAEIAEQNAWTPARATTVMLAFLRDTDPENYRAISAALVVESAGGR